MSDSSNQETGEGYDVMKAPENQDLYELKHLPNKGYGAYALQLLKPGTRILAEQPLLRVDKTVYFKADVEAAYVQLTPQEKTRYFELHSAHGQDPRYWPTSINPDLPAIDRQRIAEQHDARVAKQASVSSIFRTNCMDTGKGAAVFYHCSRFNHSCNPNAYFSWNKLLGMETIQAVKEIKAGEEITLCYTDQYQDRARRAWEHMHYGFKCDCPACGDPSIEGSWAATSAESRYRLTELEEITGPCRFTLQVMLSTPRIMANLLEMAKIHLIEGFIGQGLASLYRDIALICEAKNDTKHALTAAIKAQRVIETCCGSDCKEWQKAGEIVQRLKAATAA